MGKFNFQKKVSFNLKLTEETYAKIKEISRREDIPEQEVMEEFVRSSIVEYWEIIDTTPTQTIAPFDPSDIILPKKRGPKPKVSELTVKRRCQQCHRYMPKPDNISIKTYSKRMFCNRDCKNLHAAQKFHKHDETASGSGNAGVNAQESRCQYEKCPDGSKIHYRFNMYKRTRNGQGFYMCSFACANSFDERTDEMVALAKKGL